MTERTPRATDANGLLLGDLAEGTRVGEYRIHTRLATHGNGHLYLATHLLLPRRATIKVLPAAGTTTNPLMLELLREACIIEALDHPGIPRVYETGVLADRRPWIATEVIEGRDLAAAIAVRSMAVAEIIALVRDIADILDHAHYRGVIHRNVSPAAIIVPAQPRRFSISLVDWSGARTHDSRSPIPPFPRDSARAFLPPEQLAGQPTDGRGDVYSLGVIARELVSGAPLGTAPPVLVSLIHSMVERDPTKRPTSDRVRDTTAWLAAQIDGVPSPIDDQATEPTAITSEHSPSVAGTIDPA
jgi:serine/threonine-protein kinase